MHDRDDPAAGRTQVNLRLDPGLLKELDAAAVAASIDRTELARRLLAEGLRGHRLAVAVDEYRAGRVTAWAAAEAGGVRVYELLDRLHEEGVPYRLDTGVLERVAVRPGPDPSPDPGPDPGPPTTRGVRGAGRRRAVATASEDPGIGRLRQRYKPDRVRLLLVGESAPAGGTHVYLANSNLFRATREAVRRATGLGEAPDGEAFLEWCRAIGIWLVDLADGPVDDLPGPEREARVRAGIERLAATIRETAPERVVAVKSSIGAHVRSAAIEAGLDEGRVEVLPFPQYQWRAAYVTGLSAIVHELLGTRTTAAAEARAPYATSGATSGAASGARASTLHEAIATVLAAADDRGLTSRAIADEIVRRGLWLRPGDGAPAQAGQVAARVRRYPDRFQVGAGRIRLRDRER